MRRIKVTSSNNQLQEQNEQQTDQHISEQQTTEQQTTEQQTRRLITSYRRSLLM